MGHVEIIPPGASPLVFEEGKGVKRMKKGLWMGILWILLGMLCSYGKSWKTLEFQNGSSLISNQDMEQEKSILEKRISIAWR